MRRKEGDKGGDILRAAVRVFARDGFDGAKVTTIALEAKVATGSVYLYFAGKDDILDALFREFWSALRDGLSRIDVPNPLERIRCQLVLFYDRLVADRDLALVYLRDHHRFAAHASDVTRDYRACLDLAEKAFGDVCGAPTNHERFALSQSILFGGVRSALEYALDRPESESISVREHKLTMAKASKRVMARGGGKLNRERSCSCGVPGACRWRKPFPWMPRWEGSKAGTIRWRRREPGSGPRTRSTSPAWATSCPW